MQLQGRLAPSKFPRTRESSQSVFCFVSVKLFCFCQVVFLFSQYILLLFKAELHSIEQLHKTVRF